MPLRKIRRCKTFVTLDKTISVFKNHGGSHFSPAAPLSFVQVYTYLCTLSCCHNLLFTQNPTFGTVYACVCVGFNASLSKAVAFFCVPPTLCATVLLDHRCVFCKNCTLHQCISCTCFYGCLIAWCCLCRW